MPPYPGRRAIWKGHLVTAVAMGPPASLLSWVMQLNAAKQHERAVRCLASVCSHSCSIVQQFHSSLS